MSNEHTTTADLQRRMRQQVTGGKPAKKKKKNPAASTDGQAREATAPAPSTAPEPQPQKRKPSQAQLQSQLQAQMRNRMMAKIHPKASIPQSSADNGMVAESVGHDPAVPAPEAPGMVAVEPQPAPAPAIEPDPHPVAKPTPQPSKASLNAAMQRQMRIKMKATKAKPATPDPSQVEEASQVAQPVAVPATVPAAEHMASAGGDATMSQVAPTASHGYPPQGAGFPQATGEEADYREESDFRQEANFRRNPNDSQTVAPQSSANMPAGNPMGWQQGQAQQVPQMLQQQQWQVPPAQQQMVVKSQPMPQGQMPPQQALQMQQQAIQPWQPQQDDGLDEKQHALMEQRSESFASRAIGNLLTFSMTLSMVLTPFAVMYVLKPELMEKILDAPFQIIAPIALIYVIAMIFLGIRIAALFGCGPWYELTSKPIEEEPKTSPTDETATTETPEATVAEATTTA